MWTQWILLTVFKFSCGISFILTNNIYENTGFFRIFQIIWREPNINVKISPMCIFLVTFFFNSWKGSITTWERHSGHSITQIYPRIDPHTSFQVPLMNELRGKSVTAQLDRAVCLVLELTLWRFHIFYALIF